MPAGVVKPGQEKHWERAKQSCTEYKEGSDRYWKCVNGTFQKIIADLEAVKRFKSEK